MSINMLLFQFVGDESQMSRLGRAIKNYAECLTGGSEAAKVAVCC